MRLCVCYQGSLGSDLKCFLSSLSRARGVQPSKSFMCKLAPLWTIHTRGEGDKSELDSSVELTFGMPFQDRERTHSKMGSGDNTTCYLTFKGRDYDDVLSQFQAKIAIRRCPEKQ